MNHSISGPRHQPNLDGTRASGDAPSADQILDDLVDQITNRLQAGESIDQQEYFDKYPELTKRLSQIAPEVNTEIDADTCKTRSRKGASARQSKRASIQKPLLMRWRASPLGV